jgi:Cu-processing system ATP-binding protein
MIEIKNVSKKFGKQKVLREITLNIIRNRITAIVGPNGSGKTTLIKSILGLVEIDSGEILFDGLNIKNDITYRNRIGYMPQVGHYPENLRVGEVIELIKSLRANTALQNIDNLIQVFALEPYLDKFVRNLSGGTIQKISAVISLMFDSDIYILDEPTAGLDPVAVVELKNLIREHKNRGATFIVISHQLSEIETYAERLVFMLNGRVVIDDEVHTFVESMGKASLEESIIHFLKEQNQILVSNGYNI